MVGSCSVTASANFSASNYRFMIGGATFSSTGAALASGWSTGCGVLGPAVSNVAEEDKGKEAYNIELRVSVSATNTATGQTITSPTQMVLFRKKPTAC